MPKNNQVKAMLSSNVEALFDPVIVELLQKMTLKEKIGQLYQSAYFSDVVTGHERDTSQTLEGIRNGQVGSILSVHKEEVLYQLQKTAVEESRLGIPLLFCFDVIHGYKTAFPINLALSSTWDPELIERVSKAVAYETSHAGLHLTFSPMVDIVRDPRWGRVMESNGEDPYLSSVLAKAYVRGYEQNDLSHPHAVAACVKHFAGYGFVEAGKEYNTVDISERVFRNIVLPPFQAAIDENVSMVMTAFNVLFDRPATASTFLLKDILRQEMAYQGITISDYTSTEEVINHKVAKDERDAAKQCFNAGLDHEMVSTTYKDHLEALVMTNEVSIKDIDRATGRILALKKALGLFENPYRNFYENSEQYMLQDDTKALALEASEKSMVLLKNDALLPIQSTKKVGLIGPFIENQDVIGEWNALAQKSDVISIKDAFDQGNYDTVYVDDDSLDRLSECDVVIMALGEAGNEAGEGNSKVDLDLPNHQQALFDRVRKVNANVVLIVFAGRPLIMTHYDEHASAILYSYQPGTMAGRAIYNLISGTSSPRGKLTMTFPRHQGQIPLYYNHYSTGRPLNPDKPNYRYNSRYRDCSDAPLYPFGFGLTYGEFTYADLTLDKETLKNEDAVTVSIKVKNIGSMKATETVQCYIEALTYSVSRPVNELKAFKQITLEPAEEASVTFRLGLQDFRSYNVDMVYTAENQPYKVKVGSASNTTDSVTLNVIDAIH